MIADQELSWIQSATWLFLHKNEDINGAISEHYVN